ncbi:hypothetical protein GCM10009630_43830 [Kribbella jejuensis]|uniref:4-amino-4-deoxy-L-arabinose transferase-like glycosyltransferase n=1 Tax=Kribbella jejuensis TaxID=236068 RepID=A0A542ENP6_9ACTN|nr:hypothetical protein [Kribbella jejuensis]TQJ16935.1 hypothetical protein FB475_1045 [Kribbella jejuensis]
MKRAVPWLLPILVAVGGFVALGDVGPGPVLKYAAYFAGAIALPGTLILRAVWRSTGNWAEDLGLGSVVGATWQLIGWAIFTALGWQRWLIVWPALLLIGFAIAGRRYFRIAEPKPLPFAWTVCLAVSAAVMIGATTFGVMAYHAMPPDGKAYYPDLLYHLSMVHELTRSVPPQLPQVVGERLDYHWFANADMAAAVDTTRLTPLVVLFRLWVLPWLVVSLLVCATLARTVSRTWWTGVLAALALAAPQLFLLVDTSVNLAPPVSLLSPSQTFGMVAAVAVAVFLIELLFRNGTRWLWLLIVPVVLVGGGSKPTVLPLLVGAVGLAALYVLVTTRRLPWRLIGTTAVLLVVGAITFLSVAGSTSGSRLQFLAVLKSLPVYTAATGDKTQPGDGGLILPALMHGEVLGTLSLLLGLLLTLQAMSWAGFGVMGRKDPIAWFLLGAMIAGWAGYLLVDHPSVSESYFVYTAAPFSLAGAGWFAATSARASGRPIPIAIAAFVLSIGYAGLLVWARGVPAASTGRQLWLSTRMLLVVLGITLFLLLVWRLTLRQAGGGMLVVLVLLSTAPISSFLQSAVRGDTEKAPTYRAAHWWVYPDEAEAALWLGQNSATTDVVATNTWCRPAGSIASGCDARGYLVSGIAGRRTFLEGWAYTNQAMAKQGQGGHRYTEQPSPWPDRYALTEQALTAPTPAALRKLHGEYGVRWLYADARNGPVAPALDQLAVLRHSIGKVRIYELGQ